MFVAGCHRSGTSLMAAVLGELLVRLRPDAPVAALVERSDLEPTLDNPGGFFESPQLRLLNDELLALAGCAWDRPPLLEVDWASLVPQARWEQARDELRLLALDCHWVDKDPRLALTYRAWTHVLLRRIPLVVVLRDPLEVAASLYSRNGKGWQLDRGLVLWFLYNHHLALVAQPDDWLVEYSQLLTASESVPTELSRWLQSQGLAGATFSLCAEVLSLSVDPSLQRSAATLDAIPAHCQASAPLLACCTQAYERVCSATDDRLSCFVACFQDLPRPVLEAACSHGDWLGLGATAQDQITALQRSLEQEQQACVDEQQQREHSFTTHLEEHRALIAQQQDQIRQQQEQLASLYHSLSWRSTAPLRRLLALLRPSR